MIQGPIGGGRGTDVLCFSAWAGLCFHPRGMRGVLESNAVPSARPLKTSGFLGLYWAGEVGLLRIPGAPSETRRAATGGETFYSPVRGNGGGRYDLVEKAITLQRFPKSYSLRFL